MKVIIAGTRNHKIEPSALNGLVNRSTYKVDELVCGMAQGVDISAKVWADEKDIPVKKFHPDWAQFGRAAGPLRNQKMADYADALIAIWDGKSKGTKSMIEEMQKRGKFVMIFQYT